MQESLSKKDQNNYDITMKTLMSSINEKCDWTDKKYLKPLFEYIN